MKRLQVNEQVAVTAIGFRKNLAAYPRRMEFRGNTYDFIDAGLRCLIKCGDYISEIITMSDGTEDFRLRRNGNSGQWVLLSIIS